MRKVGYQKGEKRNDLQAKLEVSCLILMNENSTNVVQRYQVIIQNNLGTFTNISSFISKKQTFYFITVLGYAFFKNYVKAILFYSNNSLTYKLTYYVNSTNEVVFLS